MRKHRNRSLGVHLTAGFTGLTDSICILGEAHPDQNPGGGLGVATGCCGWADRNRNIKTKRSEACGLMQSRTVGTPESVAAGLSESAW